MAESWYKYENYAVYGRELARPLFMRYLEIDPTIVRTYLRISVIFQRENDKNKAIAVLDQGIFYFRHNVTRYKAVPDNTVAQKYNNDAIRLHNKYIRSYRTLVSARRNLKPSEK